MRAGPGKRYRSPNSWPLPCRHGYGRPSNSGRIRREHGSTHNMAASQEVSGKNTHFMTSMIWGLALPICTLHKCYRSEGGLLRPKESSLMRLVGLVRLMEIPRSTLPIVGALSSGNFLGVFAGSNPSPWFICLDISWKPLLMPTMFFCASIIPVAQP